MLLSRYKILNQSFPNRFVYHIGAAEGFFSEYNNMILSMLYCLEHKIQFNLYSKDANFKYDKGWSDYFAPFCLETGNLFHSFFNRRTNSRFKNSVLGKIDLFLTKIFCAIHPSVLTTYDLWNLIRSQKLSRSFVFPELSVSGPLKSVCRELINMTWIYNAPTKAYIENLITGLDLPSHYIGLHIRGGDKYKEALIQSVDLYVQKAESLSPLRIAFVLTDDYSVYEQLIANYPSWSFYTLCGKDERGYYNDRFKRKSPKLKKARYLKLFASMDILAKSVFFIGTFSSNPGMYLGMRMDEGKAFSVDIPEWTIW
jgi:hypothetical protein